MPTALDLVKGNLGVSRGDISFFERKRSGIMKGDEPLISVKALHQREAEFRLPITAQ
jgi:hypothetical protein